VAKVTMPQLGESVAEGTIGKWLKQPGDTVEKYEPLLEVITDKVNAEVPSPFAGVLKEILVEEGATVPNNAEIAVIETAEAAASGGTGDAKPGGSAAGDDTSASTSASTEQAAAASAPAAPAPAAPAPASPPAVAADATPEAEPQRFAPGDGPAGSDERPERAAASAAPTVPTAVAPDAAESLGHPDARMTPAVRRLLREHGLTAAQIVGTGGAVVAPEPLVEASAGAGAAAGRSAATAPPTD